MLQQIFSGSFNFYNVVAYLVAVLLIIFLILPFHEWAHAFVAYLLGDKEAKSRGRLTLNPISHIDMVGALAMIFVGFGWAKPVPINPNNFKKPKLGMALCSCGSCGKSSCGICRFDYLLYFSSCISVILLFE